MKQLVIDEKRAIKLYPSASADFKAILNDSFGETFFTRDPLDWIFTWENVCEANDLNPADPLWSQGPDDEIAYRQWKEVVIALNPRGWIANWSDAKQEKWIGLYDLSNSGFRLYYCDYVLSRSCAAGGSRLRFASEKRVLHADKYFSSILKRFMI